MTIEGVNICKTNYKGQCHQCFKPIKKGFPRAFTKHYKFNTPIYFCYRCGLMKLDVDIQIAKAHEEELQRLIKQQEKEIVAGEI